jgi:hypothetical protein
MKASKGQKDTLGEFSINLKLFCGPTGSMVMVTTGIPTSSATKTEILDLVTGESCADLVDFPLENQGGVGANLNGIPIVCGGVSGGYVNTCYKFTDSLWQIFASMKEKRGYAGGVTYNNKLHVFGGNNGSLLQSSEIISIDGGVEDGPDLPTAVRSHAITSFNSTVSILSGGSTSASSFSPLTWYFNHETQAFSTGPSLLEGRLLHGSATCVDEVTQEKIPIVAGGYGNGWSALQSTELLIGGQWQSGTTQCKIVICF